MNAENPSSPVPRNVKAPRARQRGQGMTEFIAGPQDPRQHWICCPITKKCLILEAQVGTRAVG